MKIKPTVDYGFQEGLPQYDEVIEYFLKSEDEENHYKVISTEEAKEELGNTTVTQKDTSDLRSLNG